MCGIFGVARGTQPTLDLAELRRARDTLIHRGPDHQADWHNEHIYISHTRLSIVDLSRDGHQPMVSDDNQTVLAVNGEIYNFVALRNELKRDHSFRSQSDSEVLLHGYRQWGIDELARRIDGMYAFSLYDASINKLFLVRDRVGIKPLYYSEPDPRWRFAWASELKALQHHLRDDLHIDHSALYDYLTYLTYRARNRCIKTSKNCSQVTSLSTTCRVPSYLPAVIGTSIQHLQPTLRCTRTAQRSFMNVCKMRSAHTLSRTHHSASF